MANETMDLDELAQYLQRDKREVSKLADRGHLPGRKVSGAWRFARAEIDHWLETQLSAYTEEQLRVLEARDAGDDECDLLITPLLTLDTVAVPMPAATRASVLRELVRTAERSGLIYDPEEILAALRAREEMATTALDSGVALPHPRRPLPGALGDSVMAYGRTSTGIPFGAARGVETDIFFLVCCRDTETHLRVLARLSRLLLRPGFVESLRGAETASETRTQIELAEKSLAAG